MSGMNNGKSNKKEDIANFLERRRLERLEKTNQRQAMVRQKKLERANSCQTLPIPSKIKLTRKNTHPPPLPVRQTLTSKKRIDKANYNSVEFDELREIIKTKYPLNSNNDNQEKNEYLDEKNINGQRTLNKQNNSEQSTANFQIDTGCNTYINKRVINKPHPNQQIPSNFNDNIVPEPSTSKLQITQNNSNNTSTVAAKTGAIPKKNRVIKSLFNNDSSAIANKTAKPKSRKQWSSPKPINISSITNLEISKSSEALDDSQKVKPKLRRSISSIHRKNKNIEEVRKCIRRSQSLRSISTPVQSIIEETYSESFVQHTPRLKISTPTPADLQKRLKKWLQMRGKPLSCFKNLHMFGINKSSQILMNDKENIRSIVVDTPKLNETFEKPEAEIVQSTPKIDNLIIVERILKDLYALIIEGYPRDQCEEWLAMVKHQYKSLKQLPIYWECIALLQSNSGDFQSAIESYQKAISEGAEQVNIENKLSNLFDKLCNLNIDPKSLNAPAIENMTLNQGADNKNTFAARIIQFAVRQKRKTKKTEQEDVVYFATPVRRSSRIWAKTPLSATPQQNVQFCNTLNSLDDKVRMSLQFTPNSALDTP